MEFPGHGKDSAVASVETTARSLSPFGAGSIVNGCVQSCISMILLPMFVWSIFVGPVTTWIVLNTLHVIFHAAMCTLADGDSPERRRAMYTPQSLRHRSFIDWVARDECSMVFKPQKAFTFTPAHHLNHLHDTRTHVSSQTSTQPLWRRMNRRFHTL